LPTARFTNFSHPGHATYLYKTANTTSCRLSIVSDLHCVRAWQCKTTGLTAAIVTNTNFGLIHNVTSIPCSTFYMQQFVTQVLLNVDCQMNLSLSNAIN